MSMFLKYRTHFNIRVFYTPDKPKQALFRFLCQFVGNAWKRVLFAFELLSNSI